MNDVSVEDCGALPISQLEGESPCFGGGVGWDYGRDSADMNFIFRRDFLDFDLYGLGLIRGGDRHHIIKRVESNRG